MTPTVPEPGTLLKRFPSNRATGSQVNAPRANTLWVEPVRAPVSSLTPSSSPSCSVSPPFVSVAPTPPARDAGTTWFS